MLQTAIAAEREVYAKLADVGIHPASVISLDGTSTARTAWKDGWNAAVEEISSRIERANV